MQGGDAWRTRMLLLDGAFLADLGTQLRAIRDFDVSVREYRLPL